MNSLLIFQLSQFHICKLAKGSLKLAFEQVEWVSVCSSPLHYQHNGWFLKSIFHYSNSPVNTSDKSLSWKAKNLKIFRLQIQIKSLRFDQNWFITMVQENFPLNSI